MSLDRFQHVPLVVELELGRIVLSLESILRLREGDVLRAGHAAGDPLRLVAGGVELGYADLMTSDEQVSARITRLTKPETSGGPSGSL